MARTPTPPTPSRPTTLSATAGNDLVYSGLIQVGNRMNLLAGNSVVNQSAKGGASSAALKGDLVNERTVATGRGPTLRPVAEGV